MGNNFISTAEVGDLGESIACRFLTEKGFGIVTRNYWKKWGEIDIVAEKNGKIHFIEVKSVTCENVSLQVMLKASEYRPEENVHPKKLKRMRRVIQSYLIEKNIKEESWIFDVLIVEMDMKNRVAKCRMLKDIIL